jgi:hypothetical protein
MFGWGAEVSNPFEAYGEKHARREKAHKRRLANIRDKKEQRDEAIQFTLYRRAHRAEFRALMEDPEIGIKVKALALFLKRMTPDSAPLLVDYLQHSEWLKKANDDTGHTVLGIIDNSIIRLRVQHGLAPFDDAIGDEPPNAFQIIRKMLTGV